MNRLNKIEKEIDKKINKIKIINDIAYFVLAFVIFIYAAITRNIQAVSYAVVLAIYYILISIILLYINKKISDAFFKEKLREIKERFNMEMKNE